MRKPSGNYLDTHRSRAIFSKAIATGRILGAHLVGPHADEVINVLGLAIRHGPTAEDIKQTMFAYPTAASDIGYML